jgi:GST-like protein
MTKDASSGRYVLHGSLSTGSTIVELMLEYVSAPYEVHDYDYEEVVAGKTEVSRLNPLTELPVLRLPSGEIMTETAAIALHLEDAFGPSLLPKPNSPLRPRALRWLAFFVSAVYPTFTYGDNPSDWIENREGRKELRKTTDEQRMILWKLVEKEAADGKWFLGSEFSVLDLYIGVMSYWRPRPEWFQQNAPKLHRIAENAQAIPRLRAIWLRHSGE